MEKKRRNWHIQRKVWASLIVMVLLLGSLFVGATTSYADSSVKAWVVNYATQTAKGNDIRTASLLEVKTSGFSTNAALSYKYDVSGALMPCLAYQSYKSPDQSQLQNIWADGPYFAKTGSGSSSVKIKITVTDTNNESSTYGKTTSVTVKGFKQSDIAKDFNSVGYGLCEIGDALKVRELLGRGGMLHVADCDEPFCYVDSCSIASGGDIISISDATTNGGKDWLVTSNGYGEAALNVKIRKTANCTFHGNTSVDGTMYIFCFKQPTVTPHLSDELIISNTQQGVTYTINGRSQTCTSEGQELTFDGLEPSTNYMVTCSYTLSNGRKAQIYAYGTTNGPCIVSFDTKGKGTKTLDDEKVLAGRTVKAPDGGKEPGYLITGWYDNYDCEGDAWDFTQNVVEKDVLLYAKWEKIPNCMKVTLKKNGKAWTGQNVSLYKDGKECYKLTDKNGVYTNKEVVNGTYSIYVNGCETGENVTFDCQGSSMSEIQTKETEIAYDSAEITTLLDGKQSGKPGEISAVQDGTVLMKAENANGKTELALLKKNASKPFEVYVDGIDTGKSVQGNDRLTVEFYETTLNVSYVTPWVDAVFTMRDQNGNIKNYFKYESTSGNDTVYSCILQKDEGEDPESYEIYEGDRDIHRTADAKKNHVCSAAFYQAVIRLYYDDVAKADGTVSISDGTDVYTLKGSNGEYKEAHVLVNETDGKEQSYTAEVKDTVDHDPMQLSTENPEAELRYYSVVGQIIRSSGAYTTSFRQVVRADDTLAAPAVPDTGGVLLEGWYQDDGYTQPFDFSTGVTKPMTLYGKMQTPAVELNGYVKCDADGTINGSGSWYKLPNLSIVGFKKDGRIKKVTIDVSGCKTIKLSDTSRIKLNQEESDGQISMTDGQLILRFTDKRTMAQVQEYLRTNLLIEPGADHTVQITVTGETY